MVTKATYTHFCDVCDEKKTRGELTRMRVSLLPIEESGFPTSQETAGAIRDMCTACQQRPVAELIAYVKDHGALPIVKPHVHIDRP